jgi:type II secretory pathway pseudopilin PulG
MGLTLIEISVVIGITIMLFAVLAPMFSNGFRNQFFLQDQNYAVEEARKGINLLVKEIREAADGDDGSFPIVSGSDNELIFFSDVDVDEVTERVHYFVNGSNLIKGVIEPTGFPLVYDPVNEVESVISKYIVNTTTTPIFRYYNGDYPGDTVNNPLATPVNIQSLKLVGINILVNVDPSKAPSSVAVQSFVQIRNVKNNL